MTVRSMMETIIAISAEIPAAVGAVLQSAVFDLTGIALTGDTCKVRPGHP
jgi:hypothetical protein